MATTEGVGLGPFYRNAGAPNNGTTEVQTLTIGGTPTGGTFTITYKGHTTAPITWTSTDNTLVNNIDAALVALPSIGRNNIVVAAGTLSSGIGTVTMTFATLLEKLNTALMVATSSLTGTSPTVAITTSTAGVTATARLAAAGAFLIDTTNFDLYQNAGTPAAPDWRRKTTDKLPVTAHTANATLTSAQTGSVRTNTGASGTITLTLPAATVGLHFYFGVGAAQELRIDPSGSETISLPSSGVPGAAGKYLAADAIGETVHLVCTKAGNWSVMGYTGTWTAES